VFDVWGVVLFFGVRVLAIGGQQNEITNLIVSECVFDSLVFLDFVTTSNFECRRRHATEWSLTNAQRSPTLDTRASSIAFFCAFCVYSFALFAVKTSGHAFGNRELAQNFFVTFSIFNCT
jgi:hypothetical protein